MKMKIFDIAKNTGKHQNVENLYIQFDKISKTL